MRMIFELKFEIERLLLERAEEEVRICEKELLVFRFFRFLGVNKIAPSGALMLLMRRIKLFRQKFMETNIFLSVEEFNGKFE